MSGVLNHVTFYLTHKILQEELYRFRTKISKDSEIEINLMTGIVTVGAIRTFHKVMRSPSEMRKRMQGVHWHGYSFHDSIRSVDPDLVHWLNQEVGMSDTTKPLTQVEKKILRGKS